MCGRWTKPEKQISVFKQKRTDACGRGLRIEKCLLTQLVRIAVVKGSYPGKPEIFRLSFHNCINCLFLCVDLLYNLFFHPAVEMYEIHKVIIFFNSTVNRSLSFSNEGQLSRN